jgi:hypothetical protein
MAIALLILLPIALLLFGSDPAPASEPERIVVVLPQQQPIASGGGGILVILLLALIGALMLFGQ